MQVEELVLSPRLRGRGFRSKKKPRCLETFEIAQPQLPLSQRRSAGFETESGDCADILQELSGSATSKHDLPEGTRQYRATRFFTLDKTFFYSVRSKHQAVDSWSDLHQPPHPFGNLPYNAIKLRCELNARCRYKLNGSSSTSCEIWTTASFPISTFLSLGFFLASLACGTFLVIVPSLGQNKSENWQVKTAHSKRKRRPEEHE